MEQSLLCLRAEPTESWLMKKESKNLKCNYIYLYTELVKNLEVTNFKNTLKQVSLG